MGQAVVDLPDPLQNRPEPAGGNDELLSQLAGEEIDRLLADKEESPAQAPPPQPDAVNPDEPPIAANADSDGFVDNLGDDPPASEPAALADDPPPQPDQPADAPPMDAPAPPVEEPADLSGDELAERAALEIAALDGEVTPASDSRTQTIPWILRPLVWLNAPLDLLPDGARAGVGKVALVTLLNAIAILVYVLMFRNH